MISILTFRKIALPAFAIGLLIGMCPAFVLGQQHPQGDCIAVDKNFRDQVWAKVGRRLCLKCHHSEGEASDSRFLLVDPTRESERSRARSMAANQRAFQKMALQKSDGNSILTEKPLGNLDHGGGEILKPSSTEMSILISFVARQQKPRTSPDRSSFPADRIDNRSFFEGVTMVSPEKLLRRLTLSLAGRLPTAEESSATREQGLSAVQATLDEVMSEPAFYDRLEEGFNDLFLMVGFNGVPERVLGYRNFSKTRLWYQEVKFDEIEDEKERRQAGYKLAGDYRDALLQEPYALIKHIVRNDLPFTQIVTADYIMVSPYTARGYGIFDEVKDQFEDPEDHMEFIPAKIPALTRRDGKPDQHSESGFYPHAGLLTTFHWLKRYPTTETNRNRLRARMYFQHFLGVDIMTLAPRVGDAAAIDAKYEIPTMQASECVVCHKTIDPIAGLFQDYYDTTAGMDPGPYSPRKEGWFTDMFAPGAAGEDLPEDERWRALQWLGERTVKDPRFAVAMVEHVYYILTGRKVLVEPEDIDSPGYEGRLSAYEAQRAEVERIANDFARQNYNLKAAFKAWSMSKFYRADGLSSAEQSPERLAELDDVGIVRLLSPEQLDRKIEAIFGWRWNRFGDDLRTLYGAIDSKEITERLRDPSGAMGAVQRMMSNEVACKNVARDFALPADQRRLFPEIEPDAIPGQDPQADQQIRRVISHLHELILGEVDAPDSDAVTQTFSLFSNIIADAKAQPNLPDVESYFCKSSTEQGPRDPDPNYTIRAWRAVVTYLLRQQSFLYE